MKIKKLAPYQVYHAEKLKIIFVVGEILEGDGVWLV